MSDVNLLECPNCGGTNFAEIVPNKHRCAYCGTVLTTPERAPDRVTCPHCGFENERGDRYCNRCGIALAGQGWIRGLKSDPAYVSILVTAVGTFIVPLLGGVVGLILGYKALREARASDGKSGSEKLARTAVVVGWAGVALSVLPVCLILSASGAQVGLSACSGLFDAVLDMLPAGLGG